MPSPERLKIFGRRRHLRERAEGIRIDRLKPFGQGIREPVELVGGPVEHWRGNGPGSYGGDMTAEWRELNPHRFLTASNAAFAAW